MAVEEKYLGYELIHGEQGGKIDGFTYWVHVYEGEERLFTEVSLVTGTSAAIHFRNDGGKVQEYLKPITLSKAKARIFMKLFEAGQDYRQNMFPLEEDFPIVKLDNDTIKQKMLTALNNIRRNHPTDYKRILFEVAGFCSLLGIEDKEYLYCAGLLLEEGLITEWDIEGKNINNGGIFINVDGVKAISVERSTRQKIEGDLSEDEYEFDVAISFAGENREIAKSIALILEERGLKVFYDDFEKVSLWGKNLYDHLEHIYTEAARVCIMLLSEQYAEKSWTSHERKSAQARAFRERREYILPIRIDDTKIPGLPETIGYLNYCDFTNEQIADLTIRKLELLS